MINNLTNCYLYPALIDDNLTLYIKLKNQLDVDDIIENITSIMQHATPEIINIDFRYTKRNKETNSLLTKLKRIWQSTMHPAYKQKKNATDVEL